MILDGIIVGPRKVPNGIKMTADVYITFLREPLGLLVGKNQRIIFVEPSYLCKMMLPRMQRVKLQTTFNN